MNHPVLGNLLEEYLKKMRHIFSLKLDLLINFYFKKREIWIIMFLLCTNFGNAQKCTIPNAQKEISFFFNQLDVQQHTIVGIYPDIQRHCIYYLHHDAYYTTCYDSFFKYDLLERTTIPIIICNSNKGIKCTNTEKPIIFRGIIDSCYVSGDKSKILIAGDGLSNTIATGTTICLNTINGSFLDLDIPAANIESINHDIIKIRKSFFCYNPDNKYCSADAGCGYTAYIDFHGNIQSVGKVEWQGQDVPLSTFKQFIKEVTDKNNKIYICNSASLNWNKWEECDLILILVPNKCFMLKSRIGDPKLELTINKKLWNQHIEQNEYTLSFLCKGKFGNGINQDCIVILRNHGFNSQQIEIYLGIEEYIHPTIFKITEYK